MNQCDCGNEADPSWCEDTCARSKSTVSELTPERVRAAAEVVRLVNIAVDSHPFDVSQIGPSGLRSYADRIEAERAAEALRERLVEELAEELHGLYVVGGVKWVDAVANPHHVKAARTLIARYPALAEQIQAAETCLHDDLRCSCAVGKGHRR